MLATLVESAWAAAPMQGFIFQRKFHAGSSSWARKRPVLRLNESGANFLVRARTNEGACGYLRVRTGKTQRGDTTRLLPEFAKSNSPAFLWQASHSPSQCLASHTRTVRVSYCCVYISPCSIPSINISIVALQTTDRGTGCTSILKDIPQMDLIPCIGRNS